MGRRIGSGAVFCALLLVASCSSGDDDNDHGLAALTVVEGLTFPTGLAQPGALDTVPAFPNLTFSFPYCSRIHRTGRTASSWSSWRA